jgi:hypothetical protein
MLESAGTLRKAIALKKKVLTDFAGFVDFVGSD